MTATESVNAVEVWYVDADEPVRAFVLGHAENAYDRERGFVDVRRPGYTGGTNPERLYPTAGEANLAALANVREALAAARAELRRLSHRELALEALTRAEPRCAGDVDREFAALPPNAVSGRAITAAAEEAFGCRVCCETCWEKEHKPDTREYLCRPMFLCPTCGNKRCPKSTNHDLDCSGSNDVGQAGSSWENVKPWPKPIAAPVIVDDDEGPDEDATPIEHERGEPVAGIPRRPALDHLEPRDIADRRVEHGERGEDSFQANAKQAAVLDMIERGYRS
jgi:hypothetical protein